MTFLEEEEVFPSLTGIDASVKDDGSKLSSSVASSKEEVNITNIGAEGMKDGKRKLSDKQDDKKVPLFHLVYLKITLFICSCFELEMLYHLGN